MPKGVYPHPTGERASHYGHHHSEATRQRLSEKTMTYFRDHPEARERNREVSMELWQDPEYREKAIAAQNEGKGPEWRRKQSEAHIGKYTGEEHHAWKGDDVGYFALHHWVHRHIPKPATCQECGIPDAFLKGRQGGLHAHNISGEYRRDPADWMYVCPGCHRAAHPGKE